MLLNSKLKDTSCIKNNAILAYCVIVEIYKSKDDSKDEEKELEGGQKRKPDLFGAIKHVCGTSVTL